MSTMPEALAQYIAVRRALGAKLREPAVRLSEFVDFLKNQGAEFITTELALCWAMQPKNAQRATWARRLSIVRRFAVWLNAADPRTQIPPPRLIGGGRRRNPPHIYPDQEVELLMAEASRLPSRRKLRAHTFTTLIGLLATTGLRPGEVLALARSDVDLQSGILSIRESKFGKSRFVPIHDSTRTALAGYAGRRDELVLPLQTEAFFVAETNRPLLASAVRRTFAKMSLAVGIRGPGVGRRVGRGPRLQDFRHTFATRKLIEWYRAGLDVERELPKLSTYLGHSDVAHTYWYISADPELLQLATKFLRGRRPGAEK
ncbi:MAG: tyrosine-type recombinase/integrase [Candidatus Acidiferrum sp.]|jgi:integrase